MELIPLFYISFCWFLRKNAIVFITREFTFFCREEKVTLKLDDFHFFRIICRILNANT
jgi:hypothetical protein